MNTCPQAAPAPLRCPSIAESIASTLALLPSGRAWQSREGGPTPFHDAAFDPAAFDPAAFDATTKPGTILYRFWAAIGAVRNFIETRLCALRLEFWCATMSETRDQWMKEYGLPDACDPFPDLCTKVAAIGGTRCEYYQEVAARAGWSITCSDVDGCGDMAGCALAGDAIAGPGFHYATLLITVDLQNSPAFTGADETPPLAGVFLAGLSAACPPDISPLMCVIERIVHAEILIEYQTT